MNHWPTSYNKTTIGLLFLCSICSLRLSKSLRQLAHVRMWGSPSGPIIEFRLELLSERFRKPTALSVCSWKAGSVSFPKDRNKMTDHEFLFCLSVSDSENQPLSQFAAGRLDLLAFLKTRDEFLLSAKVHKQYGISQLQIVHSNLHLVAYLN